MTPEEEKMVDETTESLFNTLKPKGHENDKLVSFKLILFNCGEFIDNPTKEDWLNAIKNPG